MFTCVCFSNKFLIPSYDLIALVTNKRKTNSDSEQNKSFLNRYFQNSQCSWAQAVVSGRKAVLRLCWAVTDQRSVWSVKTGCQCCQCWRYWGKWKTNGKRRFVLHRRHWDLQWADWAPIGQQVAGLSSQTCTGKVRTDSEYETTDTTCCASGVLCSAMLCLCVCRAWLWCHY